MGDPKKHRRKYAGPRHPWQKSRIDSDKITQQEFGLKNKAEIWKASSALKKTQSQAKNVVVSLTKQSDYEAKQLLAKLERFGLLAAGSSIESVLTLKTEDFLNRRLQSVVFKKGLARTMNQARQMITHGHVEVGGKKLTAPSYMVSVEEEASLGFVGNSGFSNEDHPERVRPEAVVDVEAVMAEAVVEENTEEVKEKKTTKKAATKKATKKTTKKAEVKTEEASAKEEVKGDEE